MNSPSLYQSYLFLNCVSSSASDSDPRTPADSVKESTSRERRIMVFVHLISLSCFFSGTEYALSPVAARRRELTSVIFLRSSNTE